MKSSTSRACIIFILFFIGLAVIGDSVPDAGPPWSAIIVLGGIGLLLYIVDKFWAGRAGNQDNMK